MKHPLEFIPHSARKPIFFTLLLLTLILFAVFQVLDQPLRTPTAPNGIVSFELAGSPAAAQSMLDSWNEQAKQYLAFGLGIDYLFMPAYAIALGLAALLVAGRHTGRLKSLGALAGWGALVAVLFDAIENYALLQLLLTKVHSPFPEIAYYCAFGKFLLLGFALLYSLIGVLTPPSLSSTAAKD